MPVIDGDEQVSLLPREDLDRGDVGIHERSERLGEEGLCLSLLTGYRQYGDKRCPEPRDRKALVVLVRQVEKRAELLD
jgi:hypothetical protein